MRAKGHLIGVAAGVLVTLVGFAILLLPFRATIEMGLASPIPPVDVTCKGPLIDALTSEPADQWINYSPNEGVSGIPDGSTGDDNCAHVSPRRGIVGAGIGLAGMAIIALAVLIGRWLSANDADEPASDDTPPADSGALADLPADDGTNDDDPGSDGGTPVAGAGDEGDPPA